MSTSTQVTPLETSVKNASAAKDKVRTVSVSLNEGQSAVIVNDDTLDIVNKMFATQDDLANESKYQRRFLHTATIMLAKQESRRVVNEYENAITKENKLHPAWSREKAEEEILQSKKMQNLKARVDVALSLLKTEFK